jgi:hypothetical protein
MSGVNCGALLFRASARLAQIHPAIDSIKPSISAAAQAARVI